MSFQGLTAPRIAALTRLRLPELAPVVEALAEERDAVLSALTKADDMPRVYRLQGRAAVLNELIHLVETASERLNQRPSRR